MAKDLNPQQTIKQLIESARVWAVSRAKLRKLLDSKSANAKLVERAKKAHIADAAKLEAAVVAFERLYQQMRQGITPGKRKKPFPWKKALGVVAKGTSMLDQAFNAPVDPIRVQARVVDTEGETVR